MSTILDVTPWGFTMGTTERIPVAFDVSKRVSEGQTVSNPSAALTGIDDHGTDHSAALSEVSVTAAVIAVVIDGSQLVAGQSYDLVVTFDLDENTTGQPARQLVQVAF